GCYTGQEIVARLQYLGKSKKQVIQLYSEQPLDLAVLTPLQDQQGKAIGEVACWAGQQGLAVINAGSLPAALLAGDMSLTGAGLFHTAGLNDASDTEPAQRATGHCRETTRLSDRSKTMNWYCLPCQQWPCRYGMWRKISMPP